LLLAAAAAAVEAVVMKELV
jgi:hypothetical protein